MGPYVPEEVDVFTIPHSRMKELVNEYVVKIQKTDFTRDNEVEDLLESLLQTFREFKQHEQIENTFIMKRLCVKLHQLSIKNNAVCNCHKDSDLNDMMHFIQDGYKKKSLQDRINFGLQLQRALEDFTKTFLPHMQEEEEVFQPLLLKYFTYEELCELRKKVLQQHLEHEERKDKLLQVLRVISKQDEDKSRPRDLINRLPPELLLKILSYLSPPDLNRCSSTCTKWADLTKDSSLWRHLYPSHWARGDWVSGPVARSSDDDLDNDSLEEDIVKCRGREAAILSGLLSTVLPVVGHSVQTIVLRQSPTLTNNTLSQILRLCPNLQHLDVSQTQVSDAAFNRLGRFGCGCHLTHVDLSGCINITDSTLARLAIAQTGPAQQDWPLLQTNISASTGNLQCPASSTRSLQCPASSTGSLQCPASSSVGCPASSSVGCPASSSVGCPASSSVGCRGGWVGECVCGEYRRVCGVSIGGYTPSPHPAPTRQTVVEYLNLSGCWQITDTGLRALYKVGVWSHLKCLDLSGCFLLSGREIQTFVGQCRALAPDNLFYCDNVTDGPYCEDANGCRNLESTTRICCRTGL